MGLCFFFQAEDGIRDGRVTGVQTCALPISTAPVPQPPLMQAYVWFGRRGQSSWLGWVQMNCDCLLGWSNNASWSLLAHSATPIHGRPRLLWLLQGESVSTIWLLANMALPTRSR